MVRTAKFPTKPRRGRPPKMVATEVIEDAVEIPDIEEKASEVVVAEVVAKSVDDFFLKTVKRIGQVESDLVDRIGKAKHTSKVARPELRENVLVIEPGGYRRVSLPLSELAQLDIKARYVPDTTLLSLMGLSLSKEQIIWGILFSLIGLMLVTTSLVLYFGFGAYVFCLVLGVPIGSIGGGVLGYIFGIKMVPQPLWVFRRHPNDSLEPIAPPPLLSSFVEQKGTNGNKTLMAIRGTFLSDVTQQVHAGGLLRVRRNKNSNLKFGSLICFIAAILALIFIFSVAQKPHYIPEGAVIEEVVAQ